MSARSIAAALSLTFSRSTCSVGVPAGSVACCAAAPVAADISASALAALDVAASTNCRSLLRRQPTATLDQGLNTATKG